MITNLKEFQYTVYWDPNMVWYFTLTYKLDEANKLCTIVLPQLKYEYLWSYEQNTQLFVNFTRQINTLIYEFYFLCVYIRGLLIILRGDWENN